MTPTNTGGPAFPCPDHDGLTLRDYFAIRAISGLMARNWSHHTGTNEELVAVWARSAYGVADAMLKAREA